MSSVVNYFVNTFVTGTGGSRAGSAVVGVSRRLLV
eukprot:COSAG02_NODE_28550_length_587_cov_1.247951_2_plen_34_part_01